MVQQINEVIAPALSNCKISESFHHVERVATGESNNKAPEIEISKASWTDHLCQCLANGFFFTLNDTENKYRATGSEVILMMRELFHHKKSKIQVPVEEPYIPFDWLKKKLNPSICKGNVIDGRSYQEGQGEWG